MSADRAPRHGEETVRRQSVRARLRNVGAVALRVDPDLVNRTLEVLTSLESPLAIRVAIDHDLLALTVHSPDEGWWSTIAVAGRGTRSRPRRSAAVTIDLLTFAEVVAYSGLATSQHASTLVTIRDGRSLTISRWQVRASPRTSPIELPPRLDEWTCAQRNVNVPVVLTRDGVLELPFPGGYATVRAALLERMTRRGIDRADLFESAGQVFLVGASDTPQETLNIVLVGPARIFYDNPRPSVAPEAPT